MVLSFSHLCHECDQLPKFLALLAWLELEDLKHRGVVAVLEKEVILVAVCITLDVALCSQEKSPVLNDPASTKSESKCDCFQLLSGHCPGLHLWTQGKQGGGFARDRLPQSEVRGIQNGGNFRIVGLVMPSVRYRILYLLP